MNKIVFINGVLASKEDKKLLSYNIIHNNIDFDVKRDKFGIQYVITFD